MQHAKTYDFIIIGSGIAGLNTALILSEYGKVLVVTKEKLADSSTNLAQGGIAAVMKKEDSAASHMQDTLSAGYHHNKKSAVEHLVHGGTKAVETLSKLGVKFDTHLTGELISSFEAAHSSPRIVHATDFTGREIEKILIENVLKQKNIEIWENTTAVDLIVNDKQCYGIQVIKNKKTINLFSRAVILATGGVGQLYQWTTNPEVSTGDGIAIAHRAGAKLKDMEFIQFHPTALQGNSSPLLLLSEAIRGERAILLNAKHERFMQKYHTQKELAPRDVVSRAIFNEQKNGPVYLDISHRGKAFITDRFPNITRELKKRGFDLTRQPIPVTPAAHFLCGGIKTDLYGRTSIKNLFAYGETAANGVHGANRLASNSLLEGMVFPEQIRYCIEELPKKPVIARPQSGEAIPYTRGPRRSAPSNDAAIRQEIQKIMWQYVGIIRTQNGLKTALKKLHKLQKKIGKSNMLTIALLITKAAQKRKISLGTHFISNTQTNLLQYTKDMQATNVKISLVIFRIDSGSLCLYLPNNKVLSENISHTVSLDEQVEEIFEKNLGIQLGKNYVEQLYTFSKNKNEITIAYSVLLGECNEERAKDQGWKKLTRNHNDEVINYALQRLAWKVEYTNVVYSLLPKTFTLSDLQKTYEIILGKKLDKRNFRKKILSLKFLKPTGEKRVINARPAQMYTFTKRSPLLVKVFS